MNHNDAHAPPAAPARAERAPVLVVHGVGDFAAGALVEDIAQHWRLGQESAAPEKLRRHTLFLAEHRYTVLEDEREPNPAHRTRVVEVNWSEVRRATASVWGLLKNFAWVMLTLTRLGARGVQDSATLARPLRMRAPVLVMVEAVLVWAALLPALSALLWRLPIGSRLGVCVALAAGALYLANWLRHWSKAMATGAVGFAGFCVWAGYVACVQLPAACGTQPCPSPLAPTPANFGGMEWATFTAGFIHSAAVLATGLVLGLAMLEVLWQCWAGHHRQWRALQRHVQAFSRVACLWLPAVMLAALQPLTVSALLTTYSPAAFDRWGLVYQQGMLFSPKAGYTAAVALLALLVGTIVVGALQYLAVRRFGRDRSLMLFSGLAVALGALAAWAAHNGNPRCADCLRSDLLILGALVLLFSACAGFIAFRHRPSQHAAGADWHPAGKYARVWATWLLWAVPLAMLMALVFLLHNASGYAAASTCTPGAEPGSGAACLSASDYFMRSGKFALLLIPLAAKPAAALLDALGDVFYWFVPSPKLNTRVETRSRFDAALSHLVDNPGHQHIVVFAHSQGTVIATDALCELARSVQAAAKSHHGLQSFAVMPLAKLGVALQGSNQRITLVTVGSPLSSLYRAFFGVTMGQDYLHLCRSQPQRFAWVNVCRAADYIGSRVDLPGVQNYLLATPGDHTGYWCDPVLLQWLGRYVAGQGVAQAAAFDGSAALVPLGGVRGPAERVGGAVAAG